MPSGDIQRHRMNAHKFTNPGLQNRRLQVRFLSHLPLAWQASQLPLFLRFCVVPPVLHAALLRRKPLVLAPHNRWSLPQNLPNFGLCDRMFLWFPMCRVYDILTVFGRCGHPTNDATASPYYLQHIKIYRNAPAVPNQRWLTAIQNNRVGTSRRIRREPTAIRWELSVMHSAPYQRNRLSS
jgi:hypothetical protein